MKSKFALAWVALLLSTAHASLGASALAEQPRELTLPAALSHALEHLPELAAARLRVSAARERVSAAQGAYYPSTTLRGGVALTQNRLADLVALAPGGDDMLARTTLPDSTTLTRSAQGSLTVQLELYDFGRRRHTVRGARALSQAAEADTQALRFSIIRLVVRGYLLVVRDEQRVRDAQLTVALQEKQVALIRRLVERRARPEVDLQRAEVQLRAARDALHVLEARTAVDRVQLALAAGVDSLADAVLIPVADELLAWSDGEAQLVGSALTQRPELRGALARSDALAEGALASGAALAPSLSVEAGSNFTLSRVTRSPEQAGVQPGGLSTQASLGMFVTWTGLDPEAWARRRANRAEADAAAQDAQALRRELRASVLGAALAVTSADAELERVRHLHEGALVTVEAQRTRYELGAASLLELLDAQTLEQQARAQVIDAQLALALARADLLDSAGLLERRMLRSR